MDNCKKGDSLDYLFVITQALIVIRYSDPDSYGDVIILMQILFNFKIIHISIEALASIY